jgi:hypothetical protein
MYLFRAGRPTADFFTFYEVVPPEIAAHIHRFARLHWSDWYFNRAAGQAKHAAALISEKEIMEVNEKTYKRGPDYWTASSLKWLNKWQKIVRQERPGDFASSRGLLPTDSSADQVILADLVNATTVEAVLRIAHDLAPYGLASWNALVDLAAVETPVDAQVLLARVMADPHVVPRVRQAIARNSALLHGSDQHDGGIVTQGNHAVVVPRDLVSASATRLVNSYEGASVTTQDDSSSVAPPESGAANEAHREVFTIGEKGLASPARLAQLVANLGIAHVVDVRVPPPRQGKWTSVELAKLLDNRLVAMPEGSDASDLIDMLPSGRVLVLGSAKVPACAPRRLALGDEHPARVGCDAYLSRSAQRSVYGGAVHLSR